MDKQINLFGNEFIRSNNGNKYTKKIEVPVYEPKNKKPHVLELCDKSKAYRLIKAIEISKVSNDEKMFLIDAARRHTVFDYSKTADYYAHASKEMQQLMEQSALVILDFEKSIQLGYTKLSDKLLQTYINEPTNEK